MKGMLRNEDEGADTIVWLAASPSNMISPGSYYRDRKVRSVDFAFAGTRATAEEVDSLEGLVQHSSVPPLKLKHIRLYAIS